MCVCYIFRQRSLNVGISRPDEPVCMCYRVTIFANSRYLVERLSMPDRWGGDTAIKEGG